MHYIQEYNRLFVILLLSYANSYCYSQNNASSSYIVGHIQIDSTWSPKAYLSTISAFRDIYTMSNDMIISSAEIDSLGRFYFNTDFIPSDDRLYRVHVSKKLAPAASLIIGGKDENYVLLVAKRGELIKINTDDSEGIFENISYEGYNTNAGLNLINKKLKYLDSLGNTDTYINKDFFKKALDEELRYFADTSSNSLLSLYALHNTNFEKNPVDNPEYIRNYLEKWNNEKSIYLLEFRNKYEPKLNDKKNYTFIYNLLFIFFGICAHYFYTLFKQKSYSNKMASSLSFQERKILSLIQKGKSNKEIADVCNIEVSTVKSHVSNVYSKLNISSRKEAIDL